MLVILLSRSVFFPHFGDRVGYAGWTTIGVVAPVITNTRVISVLPLQKVQLNMTNPMLLISIMRPKRNSSFGLHYRSDVLRVHHFVPKKMGCDKARSIIYTETFIINRLQGFQLTEHAEELLRRVINKCIPSNNIYYIDIIYYKQKFYLIV